ncbi:hypothetical protein [Dyella terrae]|uniref:hypothetical protein n=1 Tax=Dyella terrae TaxID=522259 RepID=UPI001EFE9479|nr:hypothetical protein [Dyella terrae]ULU25346.1 hypothetical protein DYST_02272 [Dyella terrae]
MTERFFDHYAVRATAIAEGSRYSACVVVSPLGCAGFPVYFAVCENRSFRDRDLAEAAAAKALDAIESLEDDGTPVFPEGYTGFDDEPPAP